MLQSFSWSNYFTLILGLTIIYYSIVLLLYYRKEVKYYSRSGLKDFFSGRRSSQPVNKDASNLKESEIVSGQRPASEYAVPEQEGNLENGLWISKLEFKKNNLAESDDARLFSLVHDLMDEISQELKTASHNRYVKEELIMALQSIVSQYPMLKDSAFGRHINDFIAVESSKTCSVFLEGDELDRLWKKGR